MNVLRRPTPRTEDGVRPLGAGVPVWTLAAQAYLVIFVLVDFDIFRVNPKPHFVLSMLMLGSIVLLAPRGLLRQVRVSTPIVMFSAWWCVSFVWSPVRGAWLNISMTQLAAMLILAIVASVLPWDRLIRTWLGIIYGTIAYTFLFTALHPGAATTLTDASTGALVNSGWRGAFPHKNTMAAFMVFGIVFVLSFERHTPRKRMAVAVMLVLVVLSRSGTGSACLLTVMLSLYWCRRYIRETVRRGSAMIVLSFLGSIIAVGAVVSFVPAILELYGKDRTLSGRTEIWSAALAAIRQKPWTGFGWGGVWIDPTREPTFTIVRQLGFIVFHAHNGPLEILIELGVIGLVLYLTMFFSVMIGGWQLLRIRPELGEVVVSYCVLIFVASASEVLVFGPWLSLLVMLRAMSMRAIAEDEPTPKRRHTRAVAEMREHERR